MIIKDFWGIDLKEEDYSKLALFEKAMLLYEEGYSTTKIAKMLNISKSTLGKWRWCDSIPTGARLLKYKTGLGSSGNLKWLAINSTRGGIFKKPWIRVPEKINEYKEIVDILEQLSHLQETKKLAKEFNIKNINNIKHLLFAYLLGIMIGDASKDKIKRVNRVTRRINLRLTKLHSSNEKLGKFVCLCANSFGLRMSKGKDMLPSKLNKHSFYTWRSQCSPLIAWIFNVCLGLNNSETTTYNRINAEWLLNAPRDFKIWFIQGIADSDGYVDFCTHRAGIATRPNGKFISQLFKSLNVKCKTSKVHNGTMDLVIINIRDAYSLPLFNPYIKYYRYSQVKKIAEANKFSHHWPLWFREKVDGYINQDITPSEIIKRLLEEHNIAIRQSSIYKRRKNVKTNSLVCLGIESTAL